MPAVTVSYPHTTQTAVPEALSRQAIWEIARKVRSQIVADGLVRKVPQEQLVDRTSALVVNDVAYAVHWDLEHGISQQALGATEYDPAEPSSIMVSVNGALLRGYDELMRSTSGHELGHVVFDAPGWIRQGLGQRMISLATSSGVRQQNVGDLSERRANEFMGALLAPPSLLRVDFQRAAKRHRLVAAEAPSRVLRGAPAYGTRGQDSNSVHEVVSDLADRYGVTPGFIRVRLARYDLLRMFRSSCYPGMWR
jgi:hypothetical protein